MSREAIGIDWGFRFCTQLALVGATPEGNEVIWSASLSGRDWEEIIGFASTLALKYSEAAIGLSDGNPFSNEVLLRSLEGRQVFLIKETPAFKEKDLNLKTPKTASDAMRLAVEALERQAAK